VNTGVLIPLYIAMIPFAIIGVGMVTPFVLAYAPFYIYDKCKNKN
jgi:hypothetical protein